MPLPAFKDEAEFREKWIGPFLQKLGFIVVTHTHGDSEQGKDFIFADFDKFEHIRYYAIQAKNGNIGAGNVELDKLLNQVRRSFTVRIRNQKGGSEQRISSVYVFASGKISDEAREYITEFCRSEHFGENVYFLDGDRLERIEQFASYRDDQEKRERLLSIIIETTLNSTLIPSIKAHFTGSGRNVLSDRCRTAALNQALIAFPILARDFIAYSGFHVA